MYAAMRGTTILAFLFEGTDIEYPEWFDIYLAEDCEEDGFNNLVCTMYDNRKEIMSVFTMIPYETVILFNEINNKISFRAISLDEFDELFYGIGIPMEGSDTRAALKEDCVEYFCFDEYVSGCSIPDWFEDLVYDGSIQVDNLGNYTYDDETGQDALDQFGMFLRNKSEDIRYIDYEVFIETYDY